MGIISPKTRIAWVYTFLIVSGFFLLNGCIHETDKGSLQKTTAKNPWYDAARAYMDEGAYDNALMAVDTAIDQSMASGNYLLLGNAHYLKGYVFRRKGNDQQALTHYFYALEAYKNTGDLQFTGELLNNIGKVYEKNNSLEKALKNYKEAYVTLKNKPKLVLKVLNNIGLVYSKLENYSRAITYYQEALKLAEEVNSNTQKASLMNNLCIAYRHQKEFNEAEYYGLEALKIWEQENIEKKSAFSLNNLALLYKEIQQWEQSLDYFQQSIKIKEKYSDPTLNNGYNNLAELYLEKKDYQTANDYLDKALALNSPKLDDRSQTLKLKAQIAKRQGKMEQRGDYLEQILALKDSIYNKQDTISDLAYHNLQFVQERIEYENTIHKARIDYQRQVNRWITTAVIVALVGITAIAILYWQLKQATLTMDTYTKNMAHTMRNQFNAILGNAYIVKGILKKMEVPPEKDNRPEAYEAIHSISNILQSSAETTTRIITTRHVGKVLAESGLYKPAQGVLTNIKTYTPVAIKKNITIKEEILSTPSINAHATTFEHALGNLVSNAIKYSPENSTVTIKLYDQDNKVFLEVLDEGPGIPENAKHKLFKKGAKLHNRKDIISSGMGLYFAKMDIEEMGGEMRHENRPEGGSKFIIEFHKMM